MTDQLDELDPVRFDVDPETLANRDIVGFVEAFSHRAAEDVTERVETLRSRRHRLVMTFGVATSDPRKVWEMPEVRDYVAALNASMPYLPYFFDPDPGRQQLTIWIACLAAAHATGSGALDPNDDGVLTEVAWTMRSVRTFASFLGEDPDEVVRDVFGPYQLTDAVRAMLDGGLSTMD